MAPRRPTWVALAVVLAAAGCADLFGLEDPRREDGCVVDGDCAPSSACLYGRCAPECFSDRECPDYTRCLGLEPAARCVDLNLECGTDCPGGTECIRGVCLSWCTNDVDCPGDQYCDSEHCYSHDSSRQPNSPFPESCFDELRDGNEEGPDCGGDCPNGCYCDADTPCPAGGACFEGACITDSCFNGRPDSGESGTDCGGVCPPCNCGPTFCSGYCAEEGNCQPQTCFNNAQDSDESGVDCGGPCNPCSCVSPADCPGADCINSQCSNVGQCSNNAQDANEVGVDCGGVCARKCPLDTLCNGHADCESELCLHQVCTSPRCGDGAVSVSISESCDDGNTSPRDGCSESCSVEAGYSCPDAGQPCTTINPNCNNGVQDDYETGIDCGGSECPRCTDGETCSVAYDCVDNECNGGTCVIEHCTNQSQDGDETGFDCGGSCAPCPANEPCQVDRDCASRSCSGGQCR